MNKPNKKQIILIIIAILISATIIAFPFVWNAAHKNTIEEKTLTVPLSKSLTNTDPTESYAPETGYTNYAIYKTSSGPTNEWTIIWSDKDTAPIATFKSKSYGTSAYNFEIRKEDGDNYYSAKINGKTIDEITEKIEKKEITYQKNTPITISAYNFASQQIEEATYYKYIFENPIIAGNITVKFPAIVTQDKETNAITQNKEYTVPQNEIRNILNERNEESYEQGFQDGQNQIASQIIGGPQYSWENNGIEGSYNALKDELTIPETTNAQVFMKFDLSVPLKVNDGVIIEWESITPTDGLNLSFFYVISNAPYTYIKITSENAGDKKATFLIPADAVVGSEEKTTKQLSIHNNSGETVIIKGLRIRKMSESAKQYEQGYNAGYNEGIKNAGQEYNNGYSDGLEAGRTEGSQSENFGNFIAAMFGSVLTFFLNVGNGVTIWDISLFEIAVSFIAIVVITKVVKNLV